MCPNPSPPGAGIGTSSRMPPWHPKKLQGGFKTSSGDCVPAMGVRAPALYPAAWPLAHLFRADAEMLVASPRPPAPSIPPRLQPTLGRARAWPGCNPEPQTCRACPLPPRRVFPAAPAPCPGVSDPVCTAVPAPRSLRGRLENGVARKRVSAPLLAPERFLPRSTRLPPPQGGRGGLAATPAPPGTDFNLVPGRGFGAMSDNPQLPVVSQTDRKLRRAGGSCRLCTGAPKHPKPCHLCQTPLFPKFQWGTWGLGQQ